MKKETKIFLIDICGYIVSISIVVFFFTLWLYSFNNINDALKESWTIAFSCVSALTTIGAAIIAAYLFNDWKEQHNKQVIATEAKEVFRIFHYQRDSLHNFKFKYSDCLVKENNPKKLFWRSEADSFEQKFLNVFNKDQNNLTAFCFLTEGHDVFEIMGKYRKEVSKLASLLSDKRAKSFSDTTILNQNEITELLNHIKDIEKVNAKLLNQLKTYIFY